MTTTTPQEQKNRSRVRLSSMEVLGFFDDPEQASTYRSPPAPFRRGKHERSAAGPAGAVRPAEFGAKLLGRDIRWALVAAVVTTLVITGAAAFWIYNRPNMLARQTVGEVLTQAGTLQTELSVLARLNQGLDNPSLELEALGSQLLRVEGTARDLFSAAGELSREEAAMRSLAVEAAESALNASRRLAAAHGFRAAVIPLLVPPSLETDTEFVSLEQAALDFAEWQIRFDSVLSALPAGGMEEVVAALEAISVDAQDLLPRYLDALSDGNRDAALSVTQELFRMLTEAETVLSSTMSDVKTEVEVVLQRSFHALQLLLG